MVDQSTGEKTMQRRYLVRWGNWGDAYYEEEFTYKDDDTQGRLKAEKLAFESMERHCGNVSWDWVRLYHQCNILKHFERRF